MDIFYEITIFKDNDRSNCNVIEYEKSHGHYIDYKKSAWSLYRL